MIFFFYKKILNAQKRKSNQNQLTKQKQANKKQQIQQAFTHENFFDVGNCLFCGFFYLKSLLKKNSNCTDNLIYYTIYFALSIFNFIKNKIKFTALVIFVD